MIKIIFTKYVLINIFSVNDYFRLISENLFKSIVIKKFLMAFTIIAITSTYSNAVFAHSGGLDAKGCHTQSSTGKYHCHNANSNNVTQSENFYNALLAKQLGGQTEITVEYSYGLNNGNFLVGNVRIDIVTSQYAIEGGLDKRSSLDSIQQAVFASTQLGLKPAVAIYDTDGNWGKYEHRIWTAAKKLGVKFFWVSKNKILEP